MFEGIIEDSLDNVVKDSTNGFVNLSHNALVDILFSVPHFLVMSLIIG